eukprot:CAMPEP_0195330306 /NCGR_PEP_ID=MMETSP0708-20121125/11966_1 /TAXON_ID=33640 /ORGANISM="Asterionellopsis glacialis, Strain CCMP134" /LENGTH=53 /DNA_ID=CAMNT_0040398573 /DNA_START=32 /DNA_END=193 /DNA_ORIENTATION=-
MTTMTMMELNNARGVVDLVLLAAVLLQGVDCLQLLPPLQHYGGVTMIEDNEES